MSNGNLYDPRFIAKLFDEMSRTYGFVNLISSFGFSHRWRKQCIQSINIDSTHKVLDLMSGMGELHGHIGHKLNADGQLIALDISSEMCAQIASKKNTPAPVQVIQSDALHCPIPNNSVDVIVSSFGLKTFNPEQIAQLAAEVQRILRPGGEFAFIEISIPKNPLLKWPYMFYLKRIIPLIGRLALGNPDNYRLLSTYTELFQNAHEASKHFCEAKLNAHLKSFFFGCATAVIGKKPSTCLEPE